MNDFYNKKLNELESSIKELEFESNFSTQHIETIISLIVECLCEVKIYILNNEFKNINDEIYFFKHQKPVIVAKLIYYNAIYKIETRKPYGVKPIRKYLNKELKKLKRFFDNNIDFYKYYRSNNCFVDEKFFVRGKHDIKLWLDTIYFEIDQCFSTSHDYKVAKIIANDLIQVYIENQLNAKKHNETSNESSLTWTGNKTALTELIYALYSQGVFENGNVDIKLIAKTFERTFNIELGDFYHTFMELKSRKINRTKFLDSLREGLTRKMDEQDEK